MSPGQPLPSFNSALNPDQCKTVLPNLSYPHRPITHVPWTGSSRPLRFSKTTRSDMTVVASIPAAQAPAPTTASTCCDTSSLVPTAFHGVGMFIWHKISMVVEKVKQKLFGV